MLHPISYLHLANDPFIIVMLQPTHGTKGCRKKVQAMMEEDMRDLAEFNEYRKRILTCKKCGKKGEIKRCANCKVVEYCSKEC
jgi:hypothetical protein